MKNLLKFMSPFAPDQSGAVSVLFELGGLVVICDAGGCTGNICGFDEPRWFTKKSAIASAGLRDMDAILGRDDKLISKLKDAVLGTEAQFTAIIGTPVPAVIGTDFRALKHMAQKATGIPAISVDTTGTKHYDTGIEKAMFELFKTFAKDQFNVEKGSVGVLGVTPLDFSSLFADKYIRDSLKEYKKAVCFGFGSGLDEVIHASSFEKIIAVTPAAIKTAKYLKEKFKTPFEAYCPYIPNEIKGQLPELSGKKVLVIHEQFMANKVRDEILKVCSCDVVVATWFTLLKEYKKDCDFSLIDEEQFAKSVEDGNYDVIIADNVMKRVLKSFKGEFIDFKHFAVSGKLTD